MDTAVRDRNLNSVTVITRSEQMASPPANSATCSQHQMAPNYAAIGSCPLCSQGRLIIARDHESGALYVVCEECGTEWETPEKSRTLEAGTRDSHGRSTLLKREDLVGHPWERFLW